MNSFILLESKPMVLRNSMPAGSCVLCALGARDTIPPSLEVSQLTLSCSSPTRSIAIDCLAEFERARRMSQATVFAITELRRIGALVRKSQLRFGVSINSEQQFITFLM